VDAKNFDGAMREVFWRTTQLDVMAPSNPKTMVDNQISIRRLLFKTEVILICYLLIKAYQTAYSFTTDNEDYSVSIARAASFIVYVLLSYLAYRKNKLATWLIFLTILIGNTISFVQSIVLVSAEQYLLKSFFIIMGIYFIIGSVLVLKRTKSLYLTT